MSRGGAALLLTVLASIGTWLVIARWYGEAIMRGWLLGPADMALLASAVVPCCALGVRALLRDRGPALGAVACLIVSGVLGVATSSTSWGGYGPTHHPGTIAAWVLTGALTGAAAALAPELFARAGALRRKG